ncbi:some similarities with Saccharomyces cerevisiae YOR372C NDD1 Transcriptional activator essential for nuclear division [Maudiozyma barnettii]|uniref:Some similarities with Saccharomyces cerevisiae YOR372C NDD1 Transcriptional activator essential for nuclear division n=1 Tax=Maudiozyma barnettii TaxID=61262 RepID=A0A8H2VHA0_9SACH|nr:Ndd1p [Kazachstania barnettii]CAB4255451.1 some similarities with Saccharomyces cerevisiae YOR372C NDD1 Transcriptional activator essential for nuclear division [Kazachstania barnettii]CAD1783905.1 some similarities with Saccharomyces cerevisiae YOR372C NDD1 Transcriptional activator essential for nuclear division [Kazachstania barnettii]
MSRSNSNTTDRSLVKDGPISSQKHRLANSQNGLNLLLKKNTAVNDINNSMMPILSPLKMSPPSLILTTDHSTDGNDNEDTETNFFKNLTQNLKYSINSPIPHTQFPTPYSSNQGNRNNNRNKKNINYNANANLNTNINNTSMLSSESQQQHSVDSSVLENSINTGLYAGRNLQRTSADKASKSSNSSLNNTEPTVDLMNNDGDTLEDMNMQPSTVLQFGNNFPNEFLLASPEQLKEFLFESPGGFNLFHKTPAKTPLRFVTDSKDMNINLTSNTKSVSSSNLIHLFTSGNGKTEDQDKLGGNSEFGMMNNGQDEFLSRTPLEKIDINLMFNQSNILSNSVSPSKKISMSLTPYGRRILHEMGTPFTRSLNPTNSALVDFQRARKDVNNNTGMSNNNELHSPPDDKENITKGRQLRNKFTLTPNNKNKTSHAKLTRKNLKKINKKNDKNNNTHIQYKDNKNQLLKKTSITKLPYEKNSNSYDNFENDFDGDNNTYGSSPTTIQLNSSVTKSISRLDNSRIPNLKNMELIDERLGDKLFDLNARNIPLSPTPKSYSSSNKLNIDTLKIPELPKMGSFKSDSNNPISLPATLSDSSGQQNSKFNKNSLSNSISTSTLSVDQGINGPRVKKVKKTKPKKPKFQVFVSSINKFNESNSFIPMSPKGNKQNHNNKTNNKLKRTQSLLLKKKKTIDVSQGSSHNTKQRKDNLPKARRSSSMSTNDSIHDIY